MSTPPNPSSPSPSQAPSSPQPRRQLDDDTVSPTTLRVFKTVGWVGVAASVATAATVLVLGEWGFAVAFAAMVPSWLGIAYIDRLTNWLSSHRRIGISTAVVVIGGGLAAAIGVIGVALWARNWQIATLLLAQTGPLALAFPPRERAHASDFRAITAGVGMDERRHQIRLRARAGSFVFLQILAGGICTVSFAVSGIRGDFGGADSGWLAVNAWSVWPPALWLLVICVVLELAGPLWHSRRM